MRRLFALALLCGAVALAAQTLTLERAWELAERTNPALQQQQQSLAAARERLRSAQTERLPRLNANAGYQYVSEVGSVSFFGNTVEMGVHNRWDFYAQLKQPLFTGWRTTSRIAAAGADTLAAAAGARQTDDRLRLQIAALYCQVQSLDAAADALHRGMQRADSQLQRVRAMLAAAQATPLDTLEIANRRLELQTAVAQNRHQRAVCLSQLEELVGAPLDPAPLPPLPVAQLAAADYEAAAMVARQEFTVVSAQGAQAAAQRRAALSALYPQLAAVAEYHYADPGVEYIDPDWNDYYSVGVQMQWNLWDWGQARREANAAVCAQRRAEQENSRLQAQVRREVRETVEQLNSLADRIALQRRLVQQEALRRDVMQQRFEQAQGTSLDLRDAEDRVTEAELALAQYIAQWRQARFLVDYYTGSMGGTR